MLMLATNLHHVYSTCEVRYGANVESKEVSAAQMRTLDKTKEREKKQCDCSIEFLQ